MAAMATLILLGVLVLLAGERSLVVLVPLAALLWHGVSPKLRTGRN
jgi:p-aminobenzoyl-glutamate transporter AbgT